MEASTDCMSSNTVTFTFRNTSCTFFPFEGDAELSCLTRASRRNYSQQNDCKSWTAASLSHTSGGFALFLLFILAQTSSVPVTAVF